MGLGEWLAVAGGLVAWSFAAFFVWLLFAPFRAL
jgi:hypothetical protein